MVSVVFTLSLKEKVTYILDVWLSVILRHITLRYVLRNGTLAFTYVKEHFVNVYFTNY